MSESDTEFVERIEANAIIAGADLSRLFALARRGAEMQWRPINEALPPEFKHFLATDGDVRGEAWRYEDRFYWADDTAARNITHWMPLPPPPAGEQE